MAYEITPEVLEGMIRHFFRSPEGCYLGEEYGENHKEVLHKPMLAGDVDALIKKMVNDIPVLSLFGTNNISIYRESIGIDAFKIIVAIGNMRIRV